MKKSIETSKYIPCDININNVIVYILNLENREPVCIQHELNLGQLDKQVKSFFKNKNLKFANFKECQSKIPKIIEENDFSTIANRLAEELFLKMKQIDEQEIFNDLLIIEIDTDKGQMIGCLTTIENKKDAVNKKVKFDKGAFFRLDNKSDFDLYVIDPIKKLKKNKSKFENYFSNEFLICKEIEDTRTITNLFINRTKEFIKSMFKDADEQINATKIFMKTLEDRELNIYDFAEKLMKGDIDKKETYYELVSDISISKDFTLDNSICENELTNIKLELKQDNAKIKLSLQQDCFKDANKFEVVKNENGGVNILIKNVTSFIKK